LEGKKVLVIDDDAHVRRLIEHSFKQAGAMVQTAPNGRQGLREFYAFRPDLVILDIMMPETDGWEACRQIRMLADTPIIMLTALNREEDVIRGLDLGADDFINKPFSKEVLLARARAALRRADVQPISEDSPLSYDDGYLSIDLDRRRVHVADKLIKLTPKEHHLLAYLFTNAGRVRTFRQILENVWGWAYQDSMDYVHVYMSNLRRKIEADPKDPRYLQTEHGIGYRFEKPK
jgi:two-component system KDP operon response regulator KdpE